MNKRSGFRDGKKEHSKDSGYVNLYSGVICVELFSILEWLKWVRVVCKWSF